MGQHLWPEIKMCVRDNGTYAVCVLTSAVSAGGTGADSSTKSRRLEDDDRTVAGQSGRPFTVPEESCVEGAADAALPLRLRLSDRRVPGERSYLRRQQKTRDNTSPRR